MVVSRQRRIQRSRHRASAKPRCYCVLQMEPCHSSTVIELSLYDNGSPECCQPLPSPPGVLVNIATKTKHLTIKRNAHARVNFYLPHARALIETTLQMIDTYSLLSV